MLKQGCAFPDFVWNRGQLISFQEVKVEQTIFIGFTEPENFTILTRIEVSSLQVLGFVLESNGLFNDDDVLIELGPAI